MPSDFSPDESLSTPSRLSAARLPLAERIVAGLAIVVLLWLLVVLEQNCGGLWRDEVASARLAQLPTWGQMYGSVAQDSFPPLFNTVLRLWIAVGGTGDDWLHHWGFIPILGILPALWWSTRGPLGGGAVSPKVPWGAHPTAMSLSAKVTHHPLPLLSGALLLFNPTMFYWGSSLRAYGLAALLIILLFGAVWRVVERPTPLLFALAAGLSILNAQATYQNASLIFSVCVAGAVVAALRRLWVRSALALGVGLAGAMSLLIHFRAIQHVQEWNVLIRSELAYGWFLARAGDALGSAGWSFVWLWVALMIGVLALAVRAGRSGGEREDSRMSIYAAIAIVVASVALLLFNKRAGYPTQEWYYIPFMGLIVCAVEFAAAPWLRLEKVRIPRLALAVVVMTASLPALWARAHVRRTNIDLVVAKLKTEAIPRDLILVSPFYCGIGFQYYYRGSVPWETIPPIPHAEVHNAYEQVKPYMMQNEPMGPLIEKVTATLRSGGKLWFVGGVRIPPNGTLPPASPPAPHPEYGWSDELYSQIWGLQIGYFVKQHATTARVIPVPTAHPVQRFEDLPLIEISGWRQ